MANGNQDLSRRETSAAIGGSRHYDATWIVGDSVWQVRFARQITGGAVGLCDPSTNTMFIRYRQGRIETFRTLIHEVFHAIENEYGIEIDHDLIHKLEVYFGDFIIENAPSLAKILFP